MGCSSSRNMNRSVEARQTEDERRRRERETDPNLININNIIAQSYRDRGGDNAEDPEAELRQLQSLQSDLETLERLFQTLVGRSFTAQLVRNWDAVNSADPPSTNGCPPASSEAIENLTCIEVSGDDLVEECNRECCICFFQHEVGDQVVRLPCGHLFHEPCITEWLNKNCTCPICRYELPTDDDAYEVQRIQRMSSRRMRLRPHELKRLSIWELQELTGTRESNHDRLIDMLQNSDKVDIIQSAPEQRRLGEDRRDSEERTPPQDESVDNCRCPSGSRDQNGGSTGEEEKEEMRSTMEEMSAFGHSTFVAFN